MARGPGESWRAYAVVVAGALSYTCLTFSWFALPAYLSEIIAELGLTGTEAGVLAGAVPLTYVPLGLVAGFIVDRIGAGRAIGAGAAIFGVAQVARSVAPGFPTLLAATLALGVGGTAITFGLPKLVSVVFPADRTGTPSAVYLIGASAGTAGAFAVGRPVLGPLLGGWRALFLWSGLVAVAYAGAWLGGLWLTRTDWRDPPAAGGGAGRTFTVDSLARDGRAVLGNRELRLLVVVGTMYLLCVHGLQGWLPTILETRGLHPDRAGRATSLLVAANVVGVIGVPPVADRLEARRGALMAAGGLATVGVTAIGVGGVGLLAGSGIVIVGLGLGGLSPLVRAIPPDLEGIGPGLTGAAVGFVFAVGEVGGFLGPVLLGALRDLTGSFLPGFAVLGAAGMVVVGAAVAMDP